MRRRHRTGSSRQHVQTAAVCRRCYLLLLTFLLPLLGCRAQIRPQPDEHALSVPDLVESKSTRYDPDPEDLDIGRLTMKLGRFLNTKYMSIDEPLTMRRGRNITWKLPFKVKQDGHLRLTSRMPSWLRRLQLDILDLPDGSRRKVKMSRRFRRKMLKYLHMYTHCPVRYRWKDLGIRFWPRWIRTGSCESRRSCSIPAGMTCQPARRRLLTLLRWHCLDWRRLRHCKWLRVQYPVITKCECSCEKR